MIYGSVCSGIEAASVALRPLGWEPAFVSEIADFPREILECRIGAVDAARTGAARIGVPLWGDFTALRVRHLRRLGIALPDALIGGTPCQSFSVAGLRGGLDDVRGSLALEFIRLANAIEHARRANGQPGTIIIWENVPGVLSDRGNAFGAFLGALVGHDAPLVPGRGQKWTNAGLVAGPKRSAAWRMLDAQYFGLAQRRERVFVIASPLDGSDPSEILFEPEGVRRHNPPGRGAQEGVAGTVTRTSSGRGWRVGADEAAADHVVAYTPRGTGFDAGEDGTGRGMPIVPYPYERDGVVSALTASTGGAEENDAQAGRLICWGGNNRNPIDVATTLTAHGGASGRMDFESETFVTPPLPICFNAREDAVVTYDISGSVGAGSPQAQAISGSAHGVRRLLPVECEILQGFPLGWTMIRRRKRQLKPIDADMLAHYRQVMPGLTEEDAPYIAADGPRYAAIGNSMAVPVISWIGRRIEAVNDRISKARGTE